MTDYQIKRMVERFLTWKLPEDFNPDGGIKFEKIANHQPVGTNLFTATQAELMVRHMIDGYEAD